MVNRVRVTATRNAVSLFCDWNWRDVRGCNDVVGEKGGKHHADSFFMCKCSCKMMRTPSTKNSAMSATSRTFIHQSCCFSVDLIVYRHVLLTTLEVSSLFFIVENDGVEYSKVEYISSFICVAVRPFKTKYSITTRHSILSTFRKNKKLLCTPKAHQSKI